MRCVFGLFGLSGVRREAPYGAKAGSVAPQSGEKNNSPAEKASGTSKSGFYSEYRVEKGDQRRGWWRDPQGFLKIGINGFSVAYFGNYNF